MWTLLRRLSYLLRGQPHEADLREELEIHRQFRQAHLERDGFSADEAREASHRALGNTVLAKEDIREVWLGSWDTWWQDVRYGTRALGTNPGYALVGLLTLALCIGANTAVFSVVNAVVLRPLPYADPDRLAMIWTDDVRRGLHEEVTSLPTIEDWRGLNQSFTEMAILSSNPLVLSDGATAERTKGAFVSANVFRVLGRQPLVGRLFTAEEEAELIDRVVISHRLWQRHFGGNPNVVGRTLTVDGDANAAKQGPRIVEIVGVMPPDFFFPDKTTDLWEPATMYWRWSRESSARDLRRWAVVARLRSGVEVERAEADLRVIGDRLEREYATADPNGPGFVANVVALSDQLTGVSVKRTLWTLLAAVSVLLLIGCTNIANLTLARGASRQAEFAVRRALGASRPRMARQLFIESLLLALVGGALGLLVASVTLDTLVSLSPASLLRIEEVTIDSRVLVYALLSSFLAAVLFGVLPATRTVDTSPLGLIRESGTAFTSVAGRGSRAGLIALECALAVMLLTAATLLVKSLDRLNAVPTGFRVADVVVARIALPTESSGAGGSAVAVFTNRQERFRQFAEQLAAMPSVAESASSITSSYLVPPTTGSQCQAISLNLRSLVS
jgi:predicted permease